MTKYIALSFDFQEERDFYIVKFSTDWEKEKLREIISDVSLRLSAKIYEEEGINAYTFLKYFLAEYEEEVTAEIVYSFTIDDMSNTLHTDESNFVEMW